MGKARQTANFVSDNNIFVNPTTDFVGIGSTIPRVKLDVVGVVSATSFTGNLTGTATGLSGTPNISVGVVTATTELDVGIGGTIFTVLPSRRTGIGTANPRFTLEVGSVGAAGTQLWVNGDTRIVGILSIGQGTVSIDGSTNQINVGTAVTIHGANGIQIGQNTFNSTGLTLNSLNVTGVMTASGGVNIGIQSAGVDVTTGVVTALNFVGSGNTFSYNAATKTVNISIAGGGGGSSSQLGKAFISLTRISSASFSSNYSTQNYALLTQLSNTQLMFSGLGVNSTNILIYGQPFQINANGTITLGSQSSATNTSGTSVSTTLWGEPHPGRAVYCGMQYFSSSTYTVVNWGVTCNSNNTCNAGVQNTGAYYTSAGYYWPNGGNIFGTTSGGTQYAYYAGYTYFNSQYQTGYARLTYNGSSHYTYNTYFDKGISSSTAGSWPALQHHSDTTNTPCGLVSWYSSNLSSPDYYAFTEVYGASNTNIGNASTLFGDINAWYVNGFRMTDGKAVYYYPQNGKYIVTNGSGTVLKSNASITPLNLSFSYGYNFNSIVPLGNNYFAVPSSNMWAILKLSLDGSNNLTMNYVTGLFLGADPSFPSPTTSYIGWRLAGTNQQYLVIATNGAITTYDFSPIKALMV